MTLRNVVLGAVVALAAPCALATTASDPLYGEDAQALALLQCQGDYAERYAKAVTAQRATATEVATAAHASCAAQFEAFLQSRLTAAGDAERAQAMFAPAAFVEHHSQRMRDYAHARTLDVYLRSTAAF